MKPFRLIALLVLSVGFAAMPPAFAEDEVEKTTDTIKVDAVTDYVAEHEDAIILDVRTPMEYNISHVPGAVNINVQDVSFPDLAAKLDSDKTYIVYCTKNPVGGRSMTALAKLEELGFKDLYSMEGGHVAWTEAELPMSSQEDK
jgi:thioredoxin 1